MMSEKLKQIANDAVMLEDVNFSIVNQAKRVYNGPVPRISTPVYNGKFMRRERERATLDL